MGTVTPLTPDEGREAYERAELDALEADWRAIEDEAHAAREAFERDAIRAEENAAIAEAIASGFLRWTPREAKRLAEVGGAPGSAVEMVVDDLIPGGQVILICAEEGTGKSWLAHQLAAEMVAGGKALGEFDIPRPVRSVLIVDVEQSEDDVRIIRDEMLRRGVLNAAADIYWLDATGRAFDQSDDITWLIRQAGIYRPEVIILDTATNAVTDPMDDKAVRRMTTLLRWFIKSADARAVIGLAQPRKTGQAAGDKGRSFDSLFGSRAWKSEPSAVFWMTDARLTVWKQRGNYLRRRWGKPDGSRYPYGTLERPEAGPPTVASPPISEGEVRAELEARVLELVRDNPDRYSKRQVADEIRGKNDEKRAAIERLINSGAVMGPSKDGELVRGAKLRIADVPLF
jgi:hypothetical protein